LAWYALYSTTKETPEDIKLNEEVYKQDSIKNLLDTTYFFDHSQIK
jgi:hypothetical protein